MKKFVKFGLAIATCIALLPVAANAETVLKLGSVAPATSPWGKWVKGVADKIEEVSKGELKIQLLLDSQAGDEQVILRQTMKGRLDIAFVSNTALTLISEEMALPSSPYLFDSIEQGSCVAHEHMSKIFGEIMNNAGVVPLTWMEVGQNIIFSKDPIKVPSDMNGKKVRVGPTKAAVAYINAAGGSAVPLGNVDTIPALQTGTVDAATYPTVFGIATGTQKVAPNITLTFHSRMIGTVAISKKVWDKLSDQEKQWLGVFKAAGPKLTEGILGAETALIQKVEKAGVPVYRPNEAEMAEWKGAAKGVKEGMISEIGGQAQAVSDAIDAAKEVCGS